MPTPFIGTIAILGFCVTRTSWFSSYLPECPLVVCLQALLSLFPVRCGASQSSVPRPLPHTLSLGELIYPWVTRNGFDDHLWLPDHPLYPPLSLSSRLVLPTCFHDNTSDVLSLSRIHIFTSSPLISLAQHNIFEHYLYQYCYVVFHCRHISQFVDRFTCS